MINKDSRLGILSSVEDTFFLARDKDTLYLSQSYELDKAPQLRVFAWFAVAVGLIEFDELRLPSPRTDWWKADPQHAVDVAGVNRRYVHTYKASYCSPSRLLPNRTLLSRYQGDDKPPHIYSSRSRSRSRN